MQLGNYLDDWYIINSRFSLCKKNTHFAHKKCLWFSIWIRKERNKFCAHEEKRKKCVSLKENVFSGGYDFPDYQQRWTHFRHGIKEIINVEMVYSVPFLQKSYLQFLESMGLSRWRATRLLKLSQTCSVGFISEEWAGNSIHTIPFSKKKLIY